MNVILLYLQNLIPFTENYIMLEVDSTVK